MAGAGIKMGCQQAPFTPEHFVAPKSFTIKLQCGLTLVSGKNWIALKKFNIFSSNSTPFPGGVLDVSELGKAICKTVTALKVQSGNGKTAKGRTSRGFWKLDDAKDHF